MKKTWLLLFLWLSGISLSAQNIQDLTNSNDEETRRYHASVLLKEHIGTHSPQ
jgi:hypothetical protein